MESDEHSESSLSGDLSGLIYDIIARDPFNPVDYQAIIDALVKYWEMNKTVKHSEGDASGPVGMYSSELEKQKVTILDYIHLAKLSIYFESIHQRGEAPMQLSHIMMAVATEIKKNLGDQAEAFDVFSNHLFDKTTTPLDLVLLEITLAKRHGRGNSETPVALSAALNNLKRNPFGWESIQAEVNSIAVNTQIDDPVEKLKLLNSLYEVILAPMHRTAKKNWDELTRRVYSASEHEQHYYDTVKQMHRTAEKILEDAQLAISSTSVLEHQNKYRTWGDVADRYEKLLVVSKLPFISAHANALAADRGSLFAKAKTLGKQGQKRTTVQKSIDKAIEALTPGVKGSYKAN